MNLENVILNSKPFREYIPIHFSMERALCTLYTLLGFLFPMVSFSQNLIPNNSFEIISGCPSSHSQLAQSVGWVQPSLGTSDLFHVCAGNLAQIPTNGFGFQYARSGVAMGGFALYIPNSFREYIQIELTNPLVAGVEYRFEVNVSLAERSHYVCSDFGFYLSNNPVSSSDHLPLNFTPQMGSSVNNFISDTSSWHCIVDTYLASGGEQYLTIGSFVDEANSNYFLNQNSLPSFEHAAYYYIDDLCLQPINDPPCHTILAHDGLLLDVENGEGGSAHLSWDVPNPDRAIGYRIERGDDPLNLGTIADLGIVVFSNSTGFSYVDQPTFSDPLFYKVVQMNRDGSETASEIVRFRQSPDLDPILSFGQGDDYIELVLSLDLGYEYRAHVQDLKGQELISKYQIPAGKSIKIPLEHFVNGIYLVSVVSNEGHHAHRKFTLFH